MAGSRRSGNRDRAREHTEIEDVRRFACDRCRSQKLRCERDRLSLATPLKSTPCRRCIKANVRCMTSDQAPIGRVPEDYATSRPHRRQTSTNKPARAPTASPRLVVCSPSDEQSYENETAIQPEIHAGPVVSSTGTVSALSHFDEPRMQPSDNGGAERFTARPKDMQGLHRQAPYARSARPESAKSMMSQQHQDNQNQHVPVRSPNHTPFTGRDVAFDAPCGFEDFDMIMGDDYETNHWPRASIIDRPPQSDSSHHVSVFGGSSLDHGKEAAAFDSTIEGLPPNIHIPLPAPQKRLLDDEHRHKEWTRKLSKLVPTLMDDSCHLDDISDSGIGSGSSTSSKAAAQGSEMLDRGDSPMSRLFWAVEHFLDILGDISKWSRARPGPGVLPTGSSSNGVVADVDNGHRLPQRASTPGSGSSTALVSTLMAMLSAYSGILLAYERIFKRIHQSLMGAAAEGVDDVNLSLDPALTQDVTQGWSQGPTAMLPQLQLGSFMFARSATQTLTSLQIHIVMDASLQMLSQAEASLSSILDAQVCDTDETRSCLIALLQSLTFKDGGDSVSASQAIRDNINEVRKLFLARATFTAGSV